MPGISPLFVNTMDELQNTPVSPDAVALLIGKSTLSDGMGGFYRWDPSASGTMDSTFINTIPSLLSSTGRWVRIFQRARAYPQGVLVLNGGVKTLFVTNGVTDSNGKVTVNLTEDNTTTGVPIFTEIWSDLAKASINSTSPSDAIFGSGQVAADRKTATYLFTKSNETTLGSTLLAIAGVVIKGIKSAQSGVPVLVRIEGM